VLVGDWVVNLYNIKGFHYNQTFLYKVCTVKVQVLLSKISQ